ncbi:MFS transporter [Alicyclobacillus sp. SO9]|nr:MFS transporter [Alicyclobacillus sp. SO9]
MMVWSTAGWATTPAVLAYLRTLAPKMAQVIISVNASFMQLGIALGSTIGGLIISSHYSYASLSWSAGLISIVGLISLIFSITISHRQSNAPGK